MEPFYHKICTICGTPFSSYLKSAKYCSKDCAEQAQKLRLKNLNANKVKKVFVKNCAFCGKSFQTSRSRQIYCSILCQYEVKKLKAKKNVVIKKCEICGKEFSTNNPDSVFTCSTQCSKFRSLKIAKQGRKLLIKKICPVCGCEFETTTKTKIYCSRRCQWQAIKKPRTKAQIITKICVVCGKLFQTKNNQVLTCSKQCSYIHQLDLAKHKRHEKIKFVCLNTCIQCGNEFLPSVSTQKFCSVKCRRDYHSNNTLMNRKQRRIEFNFQNDDYVEIHRDFFIALLRKIFNREAQQKKVANKKTLDDWIKEADICGLSYGYYRAYIEVFGKSFEQLKLNTITSS